MHSPRAHVRTHAPTHARAVAAALCRVAGLGSALRAPCPSPPHGPAGARARPHTELYGGLNGTYDYGPLGVQMKRAVERLWWRRFVAQRSRDVVGLDTGVLLS